MPCYGPLTAYRPKATANDKRLVFKKSDSETGIGIKVPCGKCSGCKLEKSRQWAVRCMHEKRLHTDSCFITLTYDDDNLPPGNTLVLAHYQNFLKRLRELYTGPGLRFFGCGEYGEKSLRAHYHLLLLNSDFTDKRLVKSGSEYNLYASATLSKLWPMGNHALGDVNFHSAAYVARYCMKKIDGPKATAHYNGRLPEFITMSRRPGLGTGYFDKYQSEIINHDNIIVNGFASALPRFYDGKIEHLLPNDPTALYTGFELLKIKRRRKLTWAMRADNTNARLRVREVVQMAKLQQKAKVL
jgi:hypothetical protein